MYSTSMYQNAKLATSTLSIIHEFSEMLIRNFLTRRNFEFQMTKMYGEWERGRESGWEGGREREREREIERERERRIKAFINSYSKANLKTYKSLSDIYIEKNYSLIGRR